MTAQLTSLEAITAQIELQKATLTALNKQRNDMLHEMYKSQFANSVDVLEYFELFEVQHERRVTVYYNDGRLLNELKYNKQVGCQDGYYTQSALHYIVKAYNAKMIVHTQLISLYNI